MNELTIQLDPSTGLPLYEQLYRHLAEEIKAGRLKGGMRLPSRRAMSSHLKISQQTVDNALQLLLSEGYVTSRARSGLYVNSLPPLPNIAPEHQPQPLPVKSPPLFDFSPQAADTALFPQKVFQKMVKDALSEEGDWLNKGDARGEARLRESLSEFLYQFRAVVAPPHRIIIGSGVDQLLGVLSALLPRACVIAVEDPGYPDAGRAFSRAGHRVLPVGLDAEGLDVKALLKQNADVVYLTPAHQFPLGISMPVKRRAELLQWAQQQPGRYLIEDDYDSEFRYASRPLPALQGMDGGRQVIYVGTFSRSLAPGLRIAYLVLPEDLSLRYDALHLRSGDSVSRFEQQAMASFVSSFHYARHLKRAGNVYQARCQRLCALLSSIPGSFLLGQDAGLHFLFGIQGKTEQELIKKAARSGIPLRGLQEFCRQASLQQALVLGFAGIRDEQVEPAVRALRAAWQV